MQGKLSLGYWSIRGLAERIRHILQYCGLTYDEIKYTPETKQEFLNWRPKLQQKNPAVTLPFLLDGEKVISQSDAIMVYICFRGNKPELLGRNCDEKVLLATVNGVFKDIHGQYIKLAYTEYGTGTPEEFQKKYSQDYLPKFREQLTKLNGLLKDNYMAGDLTYIDFAAAEFFQVMGMLDKNLMEQFPRLMAYQQKVWDLPQIKAYLASDRYHERPCNNVYAKWK